MAAARPYGGPTEFLIVDRVSEHLQPGSFRVNSVLPAHGQHGLSLRLRFSAQRIPGSKGLLFSKGGDSMEWGGDLMLGSGFCFGAKRSSAAKEGKQAGFVLRDTETVSFFETTFVPALHDALAAEACTLFAAKGIELAEDKELFQAKTKRHREVAEAMRRSGTEDRKVRQAQFEASVDLLSKYIADDEARGEQLRARLDRWVRNAVQLEKSPNQRMFSGVLSRNERPGPDGMPEVSHIINADIYDTREAASPDSIDCIVHVDKKLVPPEEAFSAIEGKGFDAHGFVVVPRVFVSPSDSYITVSFTLRQVDRPADAEKKRARATVLADLPTFDMFEEEEEGDAVPPENKLQRVEAGEE